MSFETVSSLEIIRLIVALNGIRVSWAGRRAVSAVQATIPTDPTDDLAERSVRQQRDARMVLFATIQSACLAVHALLLINVVVNMGYTSAPIEQPNVMTSNIAQIMIPLILTKVSELITMELATVGRLRAVVTPRTTMDHTP